MKTTKLISSILFCLTFHLTAQTIPNPGFEVWTNFGGWYDNPVSWETNNNQIFTPVIKNTLPHQGNYALQVNQFGYAKSKFPYSQSYGSVLCFVKTDVTSGDSVCIKVLSYFYGNVVDSSLWINKTSVANWSLQQIPFNQNHGPTDSLAIQIIGGHLTGTAIIVDDLSITTTGINENNIITPWKLFPLPADEYATLKFNNSNRENHTLILLNNQGQIISTISNITVDHVIIEKKSLSSGMYIFLIKRNEHIIGHGKLVIQ